MENKFQFYKKKIFKIKFNVFKYNKTFNGVTYIIIIGVKIY